LRVSGNPSIINLSSVAGRVGFALRQYSRNAGAACDGPGSAAARRRPQDRGSGRRRNRLINQGQIGNGVIGLDTIIRELVK
ncbi:hypothetical protein VB636_00705, partial [Paracoccus sp. APAP_BH8]|uniref:hypothetical protein n=1 Tax=Paracoccus sp. APAP_BH8 TaxID=3110237 RepID=UPI002FD830E5